MCRAPTSLLFLLITMIIGNPNLDLPKCRLDMYVYVQHDCHVTVTGAGADPGGGGEGGQDPLPPPICLWPIRPCQKVDQHLLLLKQ